MLDEICHVDIPTDNIGYQIVRRRNAPGCYSSLYFNLDKNIILRQWEIAKSEIINNYLYSGNFTYESGFHIFSKFIETYFFYNQSFLRNYTYYPFDAVIVKVGFSDVITTGIQYNSSIIVARMRFLIDEVDIEKYKRRENRNE